MGQRYMLEVVLLQIIVLNGEPIDYEVVRNSYIPLLSGMGPKLDLTGETKVTVTHEFHDIGGTDSNTLLQIAGGRLGCVVTLIGVNNETVYIPGSASVGNGIVDIGFGISAKKLR